MRRFSQLSVLVLFSVFALCAQQPPAQPSPVDDQEKKPQMLSPGVRLTSAKNVMIVRLRGSDIPYDTIRTTIDDWGRFTLVNTRDKADLIIEIASVGGDGDVRVSGGTDLSPTSGNMQSTSRSSRDVSVTEVTMTVSDAQNKRVLWHGTESAKYAMRQKARENNLVEAAEKLASKFHDRIEPPMVR